MENVTYRKWVWGETVLHCVVQAASEMAELNATIKQLQDAVSLK